MNPEERGGEGGFEEQGQNRKYAGEVTALPTESPLLQRYLVHKKTPPP